LTHRNTAFNKVQTEALPDGDLLIIIQELIYVGLDYQQSN